MTRAYQSRRTSWLSWYDKITAQVAGVPDTPEGDCSNETAPIINLPSQVHHAAVTIYAPRSHFRNSFTAAEFADEYRAAQIETLRASVDDRNPASLIESVQSDVSGLTGRDAVAFLRPIIENSKVPGFARSDSLTPEIRMGGVGRESWFGISASVGATASEKMNEVEVLELPNRLVLAAFRLDLSEPIRLDQCTLVVGGESSNNDADDDADDQSGKQQFG